jgi:hypothetical protein
LKTNSEFDPTVVALLERLRNVPERNPQIAVGRRAAFLTEAKIFAQNASPASNPFPMAWYKKLFTPVQMSPSFKFSLTILLVIGILSGAGVFGVAAAQNSLPNELLYPIKTLSEDLRLDLTSEASTRLALDMEFSNRRVDEILATFQTDTLPPPVVMARLTNQLESALENAASLPDTQAAPALLEIGNKLRIHAQKLNQMQLSRPNPGQQEVKNQLQSVLAANLSLAEAGSAQPTWLRNHFRQRQQPGLPQPSATDKADATTTATPTASMNGNGMQTPQNNANATSMGNGNGPGAPQGPFGTGTPASNGSGKLQNTPGANQQTPSGPNSPKKTPAKPGGPGNSGGPGGPNH